MIRQALYFTAPRRIEVCQEELSRPAAGQVLVETLVSAISAGSELLVYRDQAPPEMAVDLSIAALSGSFRFPLKYGYSAVGRVNCLGAGVEDSWLGRLVFSFQPHQSHFVAQTSELIPLPAGIAPEDAVFLANLETAVGLVMDGGPQLGEAVMVLGQGIVGLLTTALLSRFPLGRLFTLDHDPRRREFSRRVGAEESLDPADGQIQARLAQLLAPQDGADLVYELSGNPAALDMAMAVCGFAGRIVVGSWYGQKRAPVDLGGKFHRGRIRLLSSQVSTLAPELTGRWNKARRLEVAWRWLREITPSRFITGRFPLERADEAYRTLDEEPFRELQVVITYL
ncbi:MAG: zinc-binding alcohol dehydrogenase [Candidatus Tectomicrobia bacterium]|uniref:Zinc-binding alcohol dehydrogenase n=1 Tax=Tectimicrobiota bacterium TaxID=2528274 RepID=A0A932CMY3_UNCTE|nr:zinc-binding alcohol dehydrogenase [Candidatus Tectomicrobia bacterium]